MKKRNEKEYTDIKKERKKDRRKKEREGWVGISLKKERKKERKKSREMLKKKIVGKYQWKKTKQSN